MDWFLYDGEHNHERVNDSFESRFEFTDKKLSVDLTAYH